MKQTTVSLAILSCLFGRSDARLRSSRSSSSSSSSRTNQMNRNVKPNQMHYELKEPIQAVPAMNKRASNYSDSTFDTPTTPPLGGEPISLDLHVQGKQGPGLSIIVDFKYCDGAHEFKSDNGIFHVTKPMEGCYPANTATIDSWIQVYYNENDKVGTKIDVESGSLRLGQTFDHLITLVGHCTVGECNSMDVETAKQYVL